MRNRERRLLFSSLVLILAALAGCQAPETSTHAPAAAPDLAAGNHTWKTADGIEMPYTVSGDGDVTVLLVHCWMCNKIFWDAQVPVLAARYRTIAVDLPGHGQAGDGREVWTVAAYGEDIAGLMRDLDLSDVVLVGHSMGGPVSLKAAARATDRVLGIVAVDTLHDAEFDYSGERIEAFMKAFEADFAGTCGQFVQQMFPEEGAEKTMDFVRSTGCSPERSAIGVALMRDFGNIDMEGWFQAAGVPIRAVNAATPNETKIEVNRKYADFDAVLMEGVGHYPHMTRPDEFNPLLLEAIAEIAGRR